MVGAEVDGGKGEVVMETFSFAGAVYIVATSAAAETKSFIANGDHVYNTVRVSFAHLKLLFKSRMDVSYGLDLIP